MKLTVKSTAALKLPSGKSELIIFDDDVPGFGLRLRDGGSRTFVFQYKLGSKQRRIALGSVSAVDFGETRKTAEKLYARVKLGEDPAGDKAENKAKAHKTFEAVADDYLSYQKENIRERSYADVERHLRKHASTLHRLNIEKISRADIATCIAAVRKNSGAVTGNRVRATLSAFFGWAIGEGLSDVNPVIGTNRTEEKARERVLSPAELRIIWRALPADHFGSIMKLLMLTGQRAGEIAGLRRPEIHGNSIVLPGERTKNHRPHIVPLSDPALEIINAQPNRVGSDGKPRDLIFGMGEGPFSGWSNSKEALDAAIKEELGEALPHWTPHDLRRSFATHAAEKLGIQPHIIEAILNHVSGHRAGVAGIYNRAMYEPEKCSALGRWAEQLLAWVEGKESNVTPLRSPA
jgi:integrase